MSLVRVVGLLCFTFMGAIACSSEERGTVDQGTEVVTRTVVERAEPQGSSETTESSSSASSQSESSEGETATSSGEDEDSRSEQSSPSFVVGDTAVTEAGNELTVYSYEYVPSDEMWQPEPGFEYAAVDVEGCASDELEGSAGLNPFDFSLQMPDNTRLEADVGIKEPALNDTTLPPGDCVRGYVTYQVPEGTTPSSVIFTASSIIKWDVQEVEGQSQSGSATSGESSSEGSAGTSQATVEGARQAARDYYRAAGAEDWETTYDQLDSQTQSMFSEEEWAQKNQWYWDRDPTIYDILSVNLDDSSEESLAEVEVRVTGESGYSFVRNTYFVLENGEWKHQFSEEEINSFMPDASFEEFVAAQGQ